ncbi:hypothetical protein [Prescottella agglutinans]|uniref:Uncharacterized protein n=1 Tax=Prescottella agglutinans TaxID=1644129 RepID=A0ABT6MF06_9NOCA|nr:hypothetical protein [Prescottella agglutinans]MDH6282904.1 hypothetical protein [Prescottella agglutinans]
MAERTPRRRVARTWHYCCPSHRIQPGDVYLEHTEFPGSDVGWADAAGHPVRHRECSECALRYGRGHLLAEGGDQP